MNKQKKELLKGIIVSVLGMIVIISCCFIVLNEMKEQNKECIWVESPNQCLTFFEDNGNIFCVGDTICDLVV